MSNQLAYFLFIFKCCWTNIRFHPLVRILKIGKLFIPNICFSNTVPNFDPIRAKIFTKRNKNDSKTNV